ncbi:capsular exopolysaccharide family [Vibrio xiamenensis]|uniref:non-specific protein-tyrosine kinase n=1 Tax=Vibrio xiamenensis TaxID=861298 RepID=A0A1G8AFE3_9VIBR|nr:polysaccharide biosynthesis tyrosine autokinase [Vibrio xiamenensis]SDH19672.1 capsular exopolysaccharide family [Vibrio xiamenensis]
MHGLDNSIPQNEEKVIDVGKYITLVKRNWLKISLFTLLVTIVTALFVFSLTPKYTATATLLIEPQVKSAVSFEDVVGIDTTQKGYFATQIEIMKSRQVAQRVIDRLHLEQNPEFNSSLVEKTGIIAGIKSGFNSLISLLSSKKEAASDEARQERIRQGIISTFLSKLDVTAIDGTQLVNVNFTSKDPELAATIANTVGEAFIASNMDARLDATQQASSWISSRLQTLKDELKQSEDKLTDFLRKEKLIDDSGIDSQTSSLISELTIRLNQIRDRRIELQSAYQTLSARDANSLVTIPEISKHPQVISLRNVLAESQKEVNELAKRYGPKHERMQAAIAKRDSARNELNQLISQLINGVKKELESTQNQEKLIAEELNNKVAEFQDISVKKREYQSLSREVDTNRNILNVFLNRYKETAATSDYKTEYARFTDKAEIPQKASKPNKKMMLVAAFMGALFFAIAVIILIDILRNTITSVKQFEERMGLVPLGAIPQLKNKGKITSDVFFDNKEPQFGESIRAVRTALTLSSMQNGRKTLAITSSLQGEGKTTTAINVAQAFAQMENVLLIDCDLRKPAVAERFGFSKYQQGITNHILMGADLNQCIIKDKPSGLNILPAGMLTPNPQELLSSKAFKNLLDTLVAQYDRIVIDTPPTLLVNDSLIVSKAIGHIAIVAKADSTRFATLKNTMARFISHEVSIDGVIINQLKSSAMANEYVYGSYDAKNDKLGTV